MAKILLVTYSGYGNWFSLRLREEKHNVDIYYCGKKSDDCFYCLSGLVTNVITEKPDFSKYDLVLFDLTGRPKLAEEARSVTATLGDGEFNTEAEDDRLLGIQIMEEAEINVPPYETFNDIGEARSFIKKTKKRYVFKPNGGQNQDTASTYVSKSPEDMLKYLDRLGAMSKGVEFMLQEVVDGTEISTEGWFNGEEFFLINGTLEEKKFLEGGLGPNTGCSGNLVFVYDNANPPLIHTEGLGKMKDFLQQIDYRGMIDLNTIVSDTKVYGLEWTPRFGYDASATLFHLISSDLADFMGEIATGGRPNYQIRNPYGAAIRLSIPPYPSEIHGKHPGEIPIEGLENIEEIWRRFYLYDCCMDRDEFMTSGINGMIGVPIASGKDIPEAFDKVKELIKMVNVPDMQYRQDIHKTTFNRYKILATQGWLR